MTNNADEQIRYFINLTEASPALKQKLKEALTIKGEWDAARRELQQVVADLQRLNADQDRIRKNLRETPKEAEVYKTYLKKLSDQEKEIDALTDEAEEADGAMSSPPARSTTTTSPTSRMGNRQPVDRSPAELRDRIPGLSWECLLNPS